MPEELKLDLMKKFKELNVAEYTTKYGDYYGLMFAGADIATKELQEENLKLEEEQRKNNGLSDNLTKAKELLKWALHSDPEHDEDFEKKWEEAEQFLNSEVENDSKSRM